MTPVDDQPTPQLRRIGSAASWMVGAQGLSQILNIASLAVLGAVLPPDAFGTAAAALLVVNVLSQVAGAGVRGSVITRSTLDPRTVRRLTAATAGAGLAASALIVVGAPWLVRMLAKSGDVAVFRAFGPSVALWSITVLPVALLERAFLFRRLSAIHAGASLLATVAALGALACGLGIWALPIRELTRHATTAAAAWRSARPVITERTGWSRPGEVGNHGRWFLLLAISQFAGLNIDYLLVGRMTDARQLGLYAFAFNIAFLPLRQISYQLGAVLFSAAAATSDHDDRVRQLTAAFRVSVLLLCPLVPVGAALAPSLVPRLLGEEWQPMVLPLQLLIGVGVAHAIANVVGEQLAAGGHIEIRSKLTAGWALVLGVVLAVLVHRFGIDGAALGHVVTTAPFVVLYVVGGCRLLGLDHEAFGALWRGIGWPLAAQAVATTGVAVLADTASPAGGVLAAGTGLVVLAVALRTSRTPAVGELRRLLRTGRSPL